jgi:hypothetical protein
VGYGLARLSGGNVLSLAIGFAVAGALMTVSYSHKLHANPAAGATTEKVTVAAGAEIAAIGMASAVVGWFVGRLL